MPTAILTPEDNPQHVNVYYHAKPDSDTVTITIDLEKSDLKFTKKDIQILSRYEKAEKTTPKLFTFIVQREELPSAIEIVLMLIIKITHDRSPCPSDTTVTGKQPSPK
jgi:hypothetical protein